MRRLLAVALAFAAPTALAQRLPLNPAVTQDNIAETICLPGWTRTVRPPVSYTNAIKRERLLAAGLPLDLMADFQLDHTVPLSLGGAPDDPHNLALMDRDEAEAKDRIERCLPHAVCDGRVPLEAAQQAIWRDWRAAATFCAR
ncbi:hypothetical protein [Methylocystis echinoides]|uniref:HNH endonuclease n=1 Tax=Methylocystis echinoides TaxID=29468 RepID=A0A9W6GTT5_9HYPH|nr:hypothetical protein [Methylocystis echinoides]GLI92730.1 hypothetical protein LMG27198_17220 [Methylocystis echinoides]